MFVKPRKNTASASDPELQDLEAIFVRTFEPVRPRQDFVQGLRGKLSNPPSQKGADGNIYQTTLLIGAGILGSILIVAASVKTVLSLVHAVRVLRQSKA